jgi:hypothetical protein
MRTTNIKIMIAGLGLLALVGCKPATKSGVRSYTATTRNDITNTGGTGGVIQNNCQAGQSAVGAIYDPTGFSNGSTQSFEERVKLFLSATVISSEVGTISNGASDSTGVRFQGAIKLDSSGRVVLNQSKIAIKVYDSFTAQDSTVAPIPVNINAASSGQFNLQTGVGYVVFKDQYGEIRLDGRIDSQYFQGNISYTNFVNVNEGAAAATGYLGQFYVATCGMIQQ